MKSLTCFGLRSASGVGSLLALFLLLLPFNAWAALGDNAASVLTDQAQMKGTLSSTDNQTYVLHEITMTSGAKVREYVTPGGAVFGVAWEGQFPPNLELLLGAYYQQARQAVAQQAAATETQQDGVPVRRGRRPMAIQTPGLVMYQTGHMRSFHGVAYVPQLVPQGVQASEIR
jgi:hypothetical protein